MTPWQFRLCVESAGKLSDRNHDERAWFMWHQEALARSKKLPPLKDFLSGEVKRRHSDKNEVRKIDEGAIMKRMMAYNKQVKAEGV